MHRAYWARVQKRAFADTCRSLGLGSRVQIMIRAAVLVVVLLALAFLGSEDAASDEIVLRLTVAALIVGAFPLVYAWNLVSVPAQIDDEKNKTIEARNKRLVEAATALTQRAITRNSVLTLSVLLERGYELNVERFPPEQFDDWASRLSVWEVLTLKYVASKFSHQDAVEVKNIQYSTRENFIFKISDDHNRLLQQTSARIEKIRGIIERYKEAWSPISPAERAKIDAALAVFEAQVLAADGEQALNEEGR